MLKQLNFNVEGIKEPFSSADIGFDIAAKISKQERTQ